MKKIKGTYSRLGLLVLLWFLAWPISGATGQTADLSGTVTFNQAELAQMLAPIALYPDELLSQILMAATYPLEVIEASRWLQANPALWGDQLAADLERKDWDPSVKSLVNFPALLQMMSQRLEWTERLGDIFLARPDQVTDSIQRLRQKALAQGNLKTTGQQKVIVDPQTGIVVIEPTDPWMIYVPLYDSEVVYGPWWWPEYPPFNYYPRIEQGGAKRFQGFGWGVAAGAAWGYAWGGFDWRRHQIVVDSNRNVHLNPRIDRNRYEGPGIQNHRWTWIHDPQHRRGISYRSPDVARRFGGGPLPGLENRRNFRGYIQNPAPGSVPPGVTTPVPVPTPISPGPAVVRPGPKSNGSRIVQPPEGLSGSKITRPESPRTTPPVSGPPPKIPAGPTSGRVEGFRRPPEKAPSQVQPGTAFSGFAPRMQTLQNSSRGHESLSGGRPKGAGPEAGAVRSPGQGPGPGKSGPAGGVPRGGPVRERGR